ncbi:replication initiation protein RepC [Pararhizobium polonicum]|uniref:Replication initiation protein RepC n=1 Tax=Pararhizobium polonicum TaxID=1612624 RepID=A0A1C7NSQ8_9HYPH|nr:plasmid replication protein RepC [Pararhizobium polonicum]OBZ92042.1 replication initiation protein RepC [Pararhizobium polonicum]
MERGHVTTPFGRRSMTLGMLASQVIAKDIEPDKSVDKWKLYRALCEAKPRLGVTDRALAVMNALLSFYPKNELSQDNGLVVFPSNAQLSLRTHGMAEQTIRRHLAVLVEVGLLARKDSANGKRYARRDRTGTIDEAYGFSLAPLLAQSEDIERLADAVIAERLQLQRMRERLTICCRDITKLVETALNEGMSGDWETIRLHAISLLKALPRKLSALHLTQTLDKMHHLRDDTINQLEIQIKSKKLSGNPYQIERHIQNSKPDSITESEQLCDDQRDTNRITKPQKQQEPIKAFPLGMVLNACPDITMYGPGGAISSWRDLMAAAIVVRSMLGVSPGAYQSACQALGPENAAAVMACILERGEHINSAGGYLRDLTRRAEKGEFSLGPMLMALIRASASSERKAS